MDPEPSMEDLRQAILRALQEGDLLPEDLLGQLQQNPEFASASEMREFLDQLITRLEQEGYISPQQPQIRNSAVRCPNA